MSQGNPLQILADPRFHMIITRAMKRGRVVPLSSKKLNQSERSSWSSASVVSSIDLKSPEPELQIDQKLEIINKISRTRKLLIAVSIFIGSLVFIGIITSLLILIKNSSTNNATITSSHTNSSNRMFSVHK